MSLRLLVVGGRQRPDALSRPEWERHERGLILEVEPESGRVFERVDYISPPEAIPSEQPFAILFKAGTLLGHELHVCTQTEVMVYDLATWERRDYLSHPWFNDVHHVVPRGDGRRLVVSTGLDLVLELDRDGSCLASWGVLDQDPWQRFDRGVDYRKVPTTKPHGAHPNFVFELLGRLWVTRFEQKDAICLAEPGRRIAIDVERPHDGVVCEDRVFFTTVDGHLVIADGERETVERVIDLQAWTGSELALGWCRGLALLDGGRQVVVGFSRLRPTKFRENVRWVKHRLGLRSTPGNLPSRIACFDLERECLLWEQNLEQHGMAVMFSLHPLEGR